VVGGGGRSFARAAARRLSERIICLLAKLTEQEGKRVREKGKGKTKRPNPESSAA